MFQIQRLAVVLLSVTVVTSACAPKKRSNRARPAKTAGNTQTPPANQQPPAPPPADELDKQKTEEKTAGNTPSAADREAEERAAATRRENEQRFAGGDFRPITAAPLKNAPPADEGPDREETQPAPQTRVSPAPTTQPAPAAQPPAQTRREVAPPSEDPPEADEARRPERQAPPPPPAAERERERVTAPPAAEQPTEDQRRAATARPPQAPPPADEGPQSAPPPAERERETPPPPPAPQAQPASLPPRNKDCVSLHRKDDEMWFPGLPIQPSEKPVCTGTGAGEVQQDLVYKCEPGKGYLFTDANPDGLMALAVEKSNKLPKHMDQGNRELAQRIRDIKVAADLKRSGTVKVQIVLNTGPKKYEKIVLQGQLKNLKVARADLRLTAKSQPANLKFRGVLTCTDVANGCQNTLVRLEQLTNANKVARVAYAVHRWSDAELTLADQDRVNAEKLQNKGHAQVAAYLANTANNMCLQTLREANAGRRQLAECTYWRMSDLCGKAQVKQPAAKVADFRSWAVAYGRSAFELSLSERGAEGLFDFDTAQKPRLLIKGPLVVSNQKPMWVRKLNVEGALAGQIEQVLLGSNDGAGNLNLQLEFKGQPKSHTRVSVTTFVEETRFNPQQTLERARQMPDLNERELVGADGK